MSLFSKKNNDKLYELLDNDSPELHEDDILPHKAPVHALTPEEVVEFNTEGIGKGNTSALESLKKRMLGESLATPEKNVTQSAEKKIIKKTVTEEIKEDSADIPMTPYIPTEKIEINDLLDDLKIVSGETTENKKTSPKADEKTLLEKCKPFILDGSDSDTVFEEKPAYTLESVADILGSENKKTVEGKSYKYEITFDDLGKNTTQKNQTVSEPIKAEAEESIDLEPASPTQDLFDDKTVSEVQTNVPKIISDIDSGEYKAPIQDISNTATIRFTPVANNDNTSRISVSSQTRPLDLTGELTNLSSEEPHTEAKNVKLERSEFEEYTPKEEFASLKEAKQMLIKLSVKKRNSFLKLSLSVIFTILLCFAKLPFITELLLTYSAAAGIIFASFLGIIILVNLDMFISVAKITKKNYGADLCAVTASISVMSYAIASVFKGEIALDLVILGAVVLTVRAFAKFWNSAYILSGFKQISGNMPKRAVKLISDRAVTFAMAKNAIEGDVLAAAPRRARHINGYMKYSTYNTGLSHNLSFITIPSIILSVAVGLACTAYFDGVIYGLYSAAAIQCFAAMPIIFLIDNLPLYSAAKRLAKLGAMIAGKTGAEQVENANAVVFSSEDLFPSGTVSLHNMRVLSENSIDETIIRAAALTEALHSPLTPIFKKIAGTGGDFTLPEADTVKYEDKMGISGWVDNKPLFIGNRTLMEAHGIDVPSVEVDRKILRSGFFPVYVASENKACALLAVQYSVRPEIARELRRVSALGVTMLINSADPNMTEEMICDYMGLYEDSVKVMSAAGCHMYKNAVTFTASTSAPAAYKGNPIGLAAIINSASRIKKSNILLTVLYVLTAVFGAVLFAYMSFDGAGTLMGGGTVLLYSLASTVFSYILYLTQKP